MHGLVLLGHSFLITRYIVLVVADVSIIHEELKKKRERKIAKKKTKNYFTFGFILTVMRHD